MDFKDTCADTAEPAPEGGDLIGVIVRHAFLEEAIIQRMSVAVAAKDKDAAFDLCAELIGESK